MLLPVLFLLASCASLSSFESPDHVQRMDGTLYLTNGRAVTGKLVVQMGNPFTSDVKVYEDGDSKAMNFNLGEIAGYSMNDHFYELKEKKGGFGLGKRLSFMKRLTPQNSKMHLYEAMEKIPESGKVYGSTRNRSLYQIEYYLEMPDEENNFVYPVSKSQMVASFDEKLRTVIRSCPALTKKIEKHVEGDFYAQTYFKDKKPEILLDFIHHYNSCN